MNEAHEAVEELVEWVAVKIAYGDTMADIELNEKDAWDARSEDARMLFREDAKQILSHPNLYYRDFNVEVEGLHDLYKAYIPLAEALKGE